MPADTTTYDGKQLAAARALAALVSASSPLRPASRPVLSIASRP
jgi:hypothetical protein